jgi:uncharacterized membrane protein YcaP (DUF421 family)
MDQGFDLFRILFGEEQWATSWFYLEIVLRTTVMYLYTILLARVVGHDAIGQLGPFEFVLVIAVGSAAGDPMFYPEVGLLQGIAVITVVMLLHRGTGAITARFRTVEKVVQGHAILVVEDGQVVEDALGAGRLTQGELMSLLRSAGVRNTGEVEHAYLEPTGKLSVFRLDKPAASGIPTLPSRSEAG